MFTSHVDTVHMNSHEIFQEVHADEGVFFKKDYQPLGADDAAGNWLMFHMINARIPGVYAFFRGEERGGIGSTFCADHRKDLFKDIKCAIAFDRRGTSSIITHQGAGRGCSDEFAQSLSDILEMGHVLDPTGIYTDTAEFFDLVPNCTNISVGYLNEHSKKETLNKGYINKLKDHLIAADWSKLDHTKPVPEPKTGRLFGTSNYDALSGYSGYDMSDRMPIQDSNIDITPLEIGDFLMDYSDRLPRDLRDKALKLAKQIYKRFE